MARPKTYVISVRGKVPPDLAERIESAHVIAVLTGRPQTNRAAPSDVQASFAERATRSEVSARAPRSRRARARSS